MNDRPNPIEFVATHNEEFSQSCKFGVLFSPKMCLDRAVSVAPLRLTAKSKSVDDERRDVNSNWMQRALGSSRFLKNTHAFTHP